MHHTTLRKGSIYGTEDKIVFDIGSLYIKCGLSGESSPRCIRPNFTPSADLLPDGTLLDGPVSHIHLKRTTIYFISQFSFKKTPNQTKKN